MDVTDYIIQKKNQQEKKTYNKSDIIDLNVANNFKLEPKLIPPHSLISNLFQPFLKNKINNVKVTRMAEYERFKKKFKIDSDILDFLNRLTEKRIRFFLAGGKMIDWFNKKNQKDSNNDYDLWFFSQRDYDNALLYFKELRIDGVPSNYTIKPYLVDFTWKLADRTVKVQCVAGCFSGPEDTLQEFDFTVSSIGYDGDYIYWNAGTLRDLKNKELCFQNFREYRLTWYRVLKYVKRGYRISNSNLALASISMLSALTSENASEKVADFFFDLEPPLDSGTEYYEIDPSRERWTFNSLSNVVNINARFDYFPTLE